MKTCKKCEKPLTTKEQNLFCSKSCAMSYNNKGICRNKKYYLQKKLEKLNSPEEALNRSSYEANPTICSMCPDPVPYERNTMQTCSQSCYDAYRIDNLKKFRGTGKRGGGGPRLHSERSRSGWYKGIYCSSTYELAFLIYNLDRNIPIERNLQHWEYIHPSTGKLSKYYPDFIVEGSRIVEIKNFHSEETDVKTASVVGNIQVLYTEDLEEIFQYLEKKTGLNRAKFALLYEESRWLHTHICRYCNKEFKAVEKKRTFCSAQCSGKGTGLLNKHLLKNSKQSL